MKINVNTEVLPIVDANLYGTDILESINDEVWENDKELILSTFAKFGIDYVKDAFSESAELSQIKISNPKFYMPKSYNFSGDTVDFDIDVPDSYVNSLPSRLDKSFNEYLANTYRSHSGFISTMPQNLDEWKKDFNSSITIWKAIVSYIMYELDTHADYNYETNTEWFLDDCEEFLNQNGFNYTDDEYDY